MADGLKNKNGGRSWIRTSEGVSQQIYSLPPLATWVSYQLVDFETLATKLSPPHFVVVPRICIPDNDSAMQVMTGQVQDKTSGNNKSRLSKDGKWRSFPRVPNLLQYLSSETYFARVKAEGKIIRQSLETDVWTTAKLRLVDFLKKQQEASASPDQYPTFAEAVDASSQSVGQDTGVKATSKHYRMTCVRKIELSWPGLWKKRIDEITQDECSDWAAKLNGEIASQYFNNTLDTVRLIFDHAIQRVAPSEIQTKNPTRGIARAKIRSKELKLPEPDQFRELVAYVRKQNSWGKAAGELIEFLAYSGTRLYTEAQWVTWELRTHPID